MLRASLLHRSAPAGAAAPELAGVLNMNKPSGMTSFALVQLVRRISGQRKVGHGGTLDPMAEGVLLVFLSWATRVVEFAMDFEKEYLATVSFGASTDTYDVEGEVTARSDTSFLTVGCVEEALGAFVGTVEQLPPPYSALKLAGRPLYDYARKGVVVSPRPRRVTIHELRLLDARLPVAELFVRCGRGTYIRSLAHDLGRALGCGAHLTSLKRTRVGPFVLSDALPPERVVAAAGTSSLSALLHPADELLAGLPALTFDMAGACDLLAGRPASAVTGEAAPGPHRAYSRGGRLLAIVEHDAKRELWQPTKVLLPRASWVEEAEVEPCL